jgi:acyl-CoA thioesterase
VNPSRFETATAVQPLSPGVWRADCCPDWFTPRGPHGGYLAAIVMRALAAAVDDPARAARSLTLHYLRPPVEGQLEVEVTVERTGRSLTSLTTRTTQNGKLCVVGIAAFSVAFPSILDYAPDPPTVRPPDQLKAVRISSEQPPMAQQFEIRPALGAHLFSGAESARSGGWMALRDRAPVDAALLAMLADAWMPTPYMRLQTWAGAPTVDLTVHYRVPDPAAHVAPGEPILGVFDSRASADGFFDEEGELWSAGGVLLAQCRQLALLVAL